MKNFLAKYAFKIGLVQSTMALIGSLYFSELAGFPPCTLCWYQRIAMYPLVLIFAIGILRSDKNAWYYAFPLTLVGWMISLYHNLLYYNIIPKSIETCKAGVSCTTNYIEWFGFVTIPLLAFASFTVVLIALGCYYRKFLKK